MKKLRLLTLLAASLLAASLQAEVTLPFVFTDHMILQQKSTLHVEGTATPSATVLFQTTWTHKTLTAIADAGGRWSLDIATPKAGGPYRMTFSDGTPTTLATVTGFEEQIAAMKALGFDYDRIHAAYLQQREAWLQEMDKGSDCHGDGWQSPTLDDGGWKTIDLPQYFDAREMQGFDGVVYFRRTVALPASWAGREV